MPSALIIGVGKPKKKAPSMPPPSFPGSKKEDPAVDVEVAAPKPKSAAPPMAPKPKKMATPPPAAAIALGDEPEATPDGDETLQPQDVDYSANDLCGSCAHMGEDGSCVKYKFPVEETGHCAGGFEPREAEGGGEGGLGLGAEGGGHEPMMGA